MTQLAEQLAPIAEAMASNAPCRTPLLRETYCLTRGGDIVWHQQRTIGKNGQASPITSVTNPRNGEKYSVFAGPRSNGRAHFKDQEHLDVVMTFPRTIYRELYSAGRGKDAVDGSFVLNYLQNITGQLYLKAFQERMGPNGLDVEMKRIASAIALLKNAHENGKFQPAERPKGTYPGGFPRKYDNERFGSAKPSAAKPAAPKPKEAKAMTNTPSNSMLVSYSPSIRQLKNEQLVPGFKVSVTPAQNGFVHITCGAGVNEGWEQRISALNAKELGMLIENLQAVHDVLKSS